MEIHRESGGIGRKKVAQYQDRHLQDQDRGGSSWPGSQCPGSRCTTMGRDSCSIYPSPNLIPCPTPYPHFLAQTYYRRCKASLTKCSLTGSSLSPDLMGSEPRQQQSSEDRMEQGKRELLLTASVHTWTLGATTSSVGSKMSHVVQNLINKIILILHRGPLHTLGICPSKKCHATVIRILQMKITRSSTAIL